MSIPQSDSSTSTEVSKPKRAQLSHALIDVDFFHKPKHKALRRKFGCAGLVAYQEIIFQLSRATNAEIDADAALCTAEDFDVPNPEEFLAYCVKQGLIQKLPSGVITQDRVIKDQEKLATAREDYKERQKRHRDNVLVTRDTTREKRETVKDHACEYMNTEDLNTEDLKKEEKRSENWKTETTPDNLVRLEQRVFIEDWRLPDLKLWFKRSGFDDPDKAIEYAAAIVNGHLEEHGKSTIDCPAKAYSMLISWGNREAQNTKKARSDVKISEARAKIIQQDPRTASRPRPPLINPKAKLPPELDELISETSQLVSMPSPK